MFLKPQTRTGFDDVAVFNHETKMAMCASSLSPPFSPQPTATNTNSTDDTDDDATSVVNDDSTDSSTSNALVPFDEEEMFQEADDIFHNKEESNENQDEK